MSGHVIVGATAINKGGLGLSLGSGEGSTGIVGGVEHQCPAARQKVRPKSGHGNGRSHNRCWGGLMHIGLNVESLTTNEVLLSIPDVPVICRPGGRTTAIQPLRIFVPLKSSSILSALNSSDTSS